MPRCAQACPGAHRRAQARARVSYRGLKGAVSQAPSRPCHGRSGRVVAVCRAPSLAMSWLGWPCHDTAQASCSLLLVTTQFVYCDTNFLSHQPPQSRYKFCIVTLPSPTNFRSCHNTLTCIATHFSHQPLQPQSQYALVYCNTISQPTCTPNSDCFGIQRNSTC